MTGTHSTKAARLPVRLTSGVRVVACVSKLLVVVLCLYYVVRARGRLGRVVACRCSPCVRPSGGFLEAS
eukprot:901053-Pyramimonas_sp.AAC.1